VTYSSFDNSIGEWRHSRIAQHRVRCLSLRWCLLAQVSRAKLKLDNMPLPIRYAAETDARKHHESLSRDSSCGEDANKKMSWRKTKRKSKDKKAKRAALRAEATTSQCLGETLACEAQLETARNNSRSCQKELRLAHQQRDVTALEMLKIQDLYDEILERVHRELSPRSCQEELRLAHQQRDMTALEMLRIQNLYDEISERVHLELLPQLRDQRAKQEFSRGVSWQYHGKDVALSVNALRQELQQLRHDLSSCPSCPSCAKAHAAPSYAKAHAAPWWLPATTAAAATTNVSGIATPSAFPHGTRVPHAADVRERAGEEANEAKPDEASTWTTICVLQTLFGAILLSVVCACPCLDAPPPHSPDRQQMREGKHNHQVANASRSRQTSETGGGGGEEAASADTADFSRQHVATRCQCPHQAEGAQVDVHPEQPSPCDASCERPSCQAPHQAWPAEDVRETDAAASAHLVALPASTTRQALSGPVSISQAPSPWSPVELVLASFGDMSDDNLLTFEQGIVTTRHLPTRSRAHVILPVTVVHSFCLCGSS